MSYRLNRQEFGTMTHVIDKQKKARFDAQLPKDQKVFFEYAASLGGFRTLTEFVFTSAQEKADQIIASHETLFNSQRDKETFFKALLNPPKPNKASLKAAQRYKKLTSR